MAVFVFRKYLFIFFLCFTTAGASADKRFSDFKRCADEECSMLLCRGKAAKDFTGPDCRFLTFKKGETIYVYYKLSGRRSDLWAGSVGSLFGYFPKDLLTINNIYTDKELEVPAKHTDFVCFDTGFDTFGSYDVDCLLAASALLTESDKSAGKTAESEDQHRDLEPGLSDEDELALGAEKSHTTNENPESLNDDALKILESEQDKEEVKNVSDFISETPSQLSSQKQTEISDTEHQELDRQTDTPGEPSEHSPHGNQLTLSPVPDSVYPVKDQSTASPPEGQVESLTTDNMAFEKENKFSDGIVVPELKTEFGSTFDAVTSDDEDTWKVTPDYKEEVRELEDEIDDQTHESQEMPLHCYTEEKSLQLGKETSETSDSEKDIDPLGELREKQEEDDIKDSESMKTSLGDTDAAIVSDGESTDEVTSVEAVDYHILMPEKAEKAEEDDTPLVATEVHQKPKETEDREEEIIVEHVRSDINEAAGEEPNIQLHESTADEKTSEELSDDNGSEASTIQMDGAKESLGENISEKTPEQSPEELHSVDGTLKPETTKLSDEASSDNQTKQHLAMSEEYKTNEHNTSEPSMFEVVNPLENADNDEPQGDASPDKMVLEQVEKAKKEIADLFTQAIKKESNELSHIETEYDDASRHLTEEHVDQEEMLLEDENAVLPKAENLDLNDELSDDLILNNEEGVEAHKQLEFEQKRESLADADGRERDVEVDVHKKLEFEQQKESLADVDGREREKLARVSYAETMSVPEVKKDLTSADFRNFSSSPEPENDNKVAVPKDVKTVEDSESVIPIEFNSPSSEPENGEDRKDSEHPDVRSEMEYDDCVQQLRLLKNHFKDEDLERFYKYLGPQNLLRVEAMFIDLEQEMRAARLSQVGTREDIERSLESILETSETSILDEIEQMLDAREQQGKDQHLSDGGMFDEDAAVLDDFQELAFQFRQKYSTASDSTPLVSESQLYMESDKEEMPEAARNAFENISVTHGSAEEAEGFTEHESTSPDAIPDSGSDRGFEEDGGHFNKNKDIREGFKDSEELQRGPQAILENPLDMGIGFDIENPSSGSRDSPSISDYREEELQTDDVGSVFSDIGNSLSLAQRYLAACSEKIIATLPEDWQPGPTFHGFPWQPVLITAAVGIVTFLVFTWRTILAVKSRTYQLTEKQLANRIKQLFDEKNEALSQISELNRKITENEENLKESEKNVSSSQRENKELKKSLRDLQKRSEQMTEKVNSLNRAVEEEKRKGQHQADLVTETEKTVEKFNRIIKSNKDELAKLQVLMDEAKIREGALKAEVTSLEKENGSLKEQKKSLSSDAKCWEERHRDVSEKIKVFQKSQRDLEDALTHKENEIEVLSECIAELRQLDTSESAELQKGDPQILANGEPAGKRTDAVKIRIKQMMDVSRVKTTLSIVEEERNMYLGKLLSEEKTRLELEEQIKKLEHDRALLHSEKCQLEDQFKTIQQKLEIMNELYQQKENALQQKLTQEEFERREKENKLSEVDGKALRAEEELKTYKKRIQEIEEELRKTERSYKAQIASHEKKAHENWLNARASERALAEEKRETANLRQKLVEVGDKLAELQRPLFKPTPSHSDRQVPGFRKGDSFGPSPVGGGAPSPPLMIEGPGRPPSAPVGRRGEPFGPRPPSDLHGRYSDLGHPLPPRPAPRTSSPSTLDGSREPVESEAQSSVQTSTVATSSKSVGQPSFMESPIRDSPVPGPLPPHPKVQVPPNGPLGSMLRPPNGPPPHPAMGPGPYGPPRHYGPMQPPFVRGPPPPLRDFPMAVPPPFGPRDFHPDIRNPGAGLREYPFGPRPLLPPPGRDYSGLPPPQHMGASPRDITEGPPPAPGTSRDYPPQQGPLRDTPAVPQTRP